MSKAFSVIVRAIALWWSNFMMLMFFNIIWLMLQIPIVTGPPATAAMYVIAHRLTDDELIDPRDGWDALQRVFLPAIKWGVINLLIVVVVIGNFWAYQSNIGTGWTILRLTWGTIVLGWFAVNFFYWPFWLVQEDLSFQTTLRNGFLFIAKHPTFTLTLFLISALFIVFSVMTALPLATIMISWLALFGILAVEEELEGTT
jgi:hypothetical protein